MSLDLNQNLSEHFKLWEFITSQTAERRGINNIPNKVVESIIVANLKNLCETILEPARKELGPLRISSGYRCKELNKAIGGAEKSAHIFGHAADILPLKASKMDFARWVVHNVPFDQVILEYGQKNDPAWIHVSADPKLRGQIFQILTGTGYKSVKI